MKSEIKSFEDLSEVIKRDIGEVLCPRKLFYFARTSKPHWKLFKPLVDVYKLLNHVVSCDYDAVQSIIKGDINIIFKRGKVTDCSGRIFDNISAFEFSLWALDKHMWTLMQECFPKNKKNNDLYNKLNSQYEKVKTKGVTYSLNGKKVTESHFDFDNTIIKELQIQFDSVNAPQANDWGTIDKQWIEGVGGAQKLLPMHVVYEYCSDQPFFPIPQFISRPKSMKQFYNWITGAYENWYHPASKLGINFALYKGGHNKSNISDAGGFCQDLFALKKLFSSRIIDFINLKSLIENQLTIDYHNFAEESKNQTSYSP
ncbi:hypothetical protein LEAN103870_19700 [Legionella anisa]|uniref:Uncharacterized protein n=1 Tax=Legionella anisa TaxID=28082 RepID=A0AAX0WVU8_9GAMM|nr:hypothetical protein [Legionella anisa]AWN73830.1 hypothetical protein DLD14_08270 [Legionella anisa]KTC75256.1 hypothetical protein Lani_0686 [Legionella anisa]MCW8426085.1 F-box protein [Legionella anisa]MCW8448396.1 F-box protein [Legionella anisa]PNL62265.1 hypothetical protein A6J39_014150 [Legionella anisa]